MSGLSSLPDLPEDALRALSAQYAIAVDARDLQLLLDVFLPSAEVLVFEPPGLGPVPSGRMGGHEEIGRIIRGISLYPKTVHLLESCSFALEGSAVSGSVECMAHHHLADPPGTDRVMRVHYDDVYQRDERGRWKIARRQVRILAREDRPLPAG